MKRALAALSVLLASCASEPSSLRLQLSVAPDAPLAGGGVVALSLYGAKGRVLDGVVLSRPPPGDLVILLDDDVGSVRVLARIDRDGQRLATGVGTVTVAPRKETLLALVLSSGVMPDQDGDGVPDVIDDCPGMADPAQTCAPSVVPMTCGDGKVDPGEDCDDGDARSDVASVAAKCTTLCKARAPCGALTGSAASIVDRATGHCYVLWPTLLDFTTAEAQCNLRGGHLASITSDSEQSVVQALAAGQPSWLGLVVPSAAPPWTWTSGEVSSYSDPVGSAAGTCVALGATGAWAKQPCGWPASGDLPASPAASQGFVCEHTCGNGVVDPGEECDPPGPACTAICRAKRPCTEPGGMLSTTTGRCYFKTGVAQTYDNARASACPTGTHLATPVGPADTEAAKLATDADAWLAVRAVATIGQFAFEGSTDSLDVARYHGFATADPEYGAVPACVVMSHLHAQGDGWRDRPCTDLYPALCERD